VIEHPQRGVCIPEDLPHETILKTAAPYLGESISKQSPWTPIAHGCDAFEKFNNHPTIHREDPWQFKNFLIRVS